MPRAVTTTATSSTIAQPIGSQSRSTPLSRATQGLAKVFFTGDDLRQPSKLYLVLHAIQQNVTLALRALSSNPTIGGNLLTGVVFTAGQTLSLQHGLGRAPRGFIVADAAGNPPLLMRGALPAGVSPADRIAITSTNAGTYSLWIY